ncbi:MAG: hypothetical protein IJW51_08335 [Clostridia bacterium]|nr:hypothetical protein [Clostridia bacterium]
MANHPYDRKPDLMRSGLPKNGLGVRGSVAYRQLSDRNANYKNYPRWFFITVNVILILLALAVVTTLVLTFALPRFLPTAAERRELTCTLEFYDISGAIGNAPTVGTSLIDPATGEPIGDIVATEVRAHTLSAVLWQEDWEQLPADAVASELTMPVSIVSVTVRLTAEYRAGQGYTRDGVRIAVGERYAVSLAGIVASGTCVLLESEV